MRFLRFARLVLDMCQKIAHSAREFFLKLDHTLTMTLYQHMLVFYGVMATLATLITFFLAKDRLSMKVLSALLVGATWPMSFPVALMFSLF